jgi:hypothetical protein
MDLQTKYESKTKEVEQQLQQIKLTIKKHNRKFKQEPNNWGYLGDLGYVSDKLNEIIQFIRV